MSVICKGLEGFGDRIQTLSYAIYYCEKYHRKLYVDWSDFVWSQDDKNISFYTYFNIKNIESVDINDLLHKNLTVYPLYWKYKLEKPAQNWCYIVSEDLNIDDQPRTEDIIVITNVGVRSIFTKKLSLTLGIIPSLAKTLTKTISKYGMYIAIHLRGSDKNVGILDEMFARYKYILDNCGGKINTVVLSDDIILANEWAILSPDSIINKEYLNKIGMSDNGSHKTKYNCITKDELNKQLITDFFTIVYARYSLSNDCSSTFFKMAIDIGNDNKILKYT